MRSGLAPLHGELAEAFEMVHFQETSVTDDHWKAYLESTAPEPQRKQALAAGYWQFVAAVSGGVFAGHLTERAPAEMPKVMDVVREHFIQAASSVPMEFKFPCTVMVLSRK